MRPRNYPRHISLTRLLEAVQPLGIISHSSLAKAMGTTSQAVTNWASRGVPPDVAVKAGELFNLSPLWITTGEDPALHGQNIPHMGEESVRLAGKRETTDVRYLARLLDAIPLERRQQAYVAATQVLIGFLDVADKNPATPAPATHQSSASTSG